MYEKQPAEEGLTYRKCLTDGSYYYFIIEVHAHSQLHLVVVKSELSNKCSNT